MKREFRANDGKSHTGIKLNRLKVLGLGADLDL